MAREREDRCHTVTGSTLFMTSLEKQTGWYQFIPDHWVWSLSSIGDRLGSNLYSMQQLSVLGGTGVAQIMPAIETVITGIGRIPGWVTTLHHPNTQIHLEYMILLSFGVYDSPFIFSFKLLYALLNNWHGPPQRWDLHKLWGLCTLHSLGQQQDGKVQPLWRQFGLEQLGGEGATISPWRTFSPWSSPMLGRAEELAGMVWAGGRGHRLGSGWLRAAVLVRISNAWSWGLGTGTRSWQESKPEPSEEEQPEPPAGAASRSVRCLLGLGVWEYCVFGLGIQELERNENVSEWPTVLAER